MPNRAPRYEHDDRIWAKIRLRAAHMRYAANPTRENNAAINAALHELTAAMVDHPMTQDEWNLQHTIPPYTFELYTWCPIHREYHERGVDICSSCA